MLFYVSSTPFASVHFIQPITVLMKLMTPRTTQGVKIMLKQQSKHYHLVKGDSVSSRTWSHLLNQAMSSAASPQNSSGLVVLLRCTASNRRRYAPAYTAQWRVSFSPQFSPRCFVWGDENNGGNRGVSMSIFLDTLCRCLFKVIRGHSRSNLEGRKFNRKCEKNIMYI